MIELVASDTGSKLTVVLTDAGTGNAIDLTGSTVKLKYRLGGGALVTKTMTVTAPATQGIATYQFGTGELTAGTLNAEVEITDQSGNVITSSSEIGVDVRAKL